MKKEADLLREHEEREQARIKTEAEMRIKKEADELKNKEELEKQIEKQTETLLKIEKMWRLKLDENMKREKIGLKFD